MRVLMPLPSRDFDPTESAVPWRVLTEAGHRVDFATPDGLPGQADGRMITGRGLFIWSSLLRADALARATYADMIAAPAFQKPLAYESLDASAFDALVLPGGHAPGMKAYLESTLLGALVGEMFAADKPVGAICHGVVLAARSHDPRTGASVLAGRRTTALTRALELSGFALTALWLGRYYRTYPQTVQAEVIAALGDPKLFDPGPPALLRDAPDKLSRGFTVRDGRYLSARWPGDAWRFSTEFAALLAEPH
ncbi:MAG: DJ-1/PfpI family protein [Myxococcales bacterium]|nr:DJ-1/PfpI family protein [Myxococcales bacterium]